MELEALIDKCHDLLVVYHKAGATASPLDPFQIVRLRASGGRHECAEREIASGYPTVRGAGILSSAQQK